MTVNGPSKGKRKTEKEKSHHDFISEMIYDAKLAGDFRYAVIAEL